MNVPNALTVLRIALIPTYLYIFFDPFPYHISIAYLILILAGLTDIVDGYIARKYKLVTPFGTMMDPLADKLMMMAVIASLFLTERISVWATIVFFMRDLAMIVTSAFYHIRGKKTVPANAFGKVTTVMFYIAFTLVMFQFPYGEPVLWMVIAFSIVTSAVYLMKVRLLNKLYVK
ncbi:CDP-diacylglycerol--glycerol-3-phosphate 3-phosphatidyltransferase [Brevibacillus migulae]|uniref:CDP-diacylglycerol--glycerol-3-phosphate 3-phosphatidyltransferase n=1 Tax=Brevibacillus migulae TaxID=1644114 RepID=UPI00106E01FC|nr:CDP-diacylglycerol--glycerol-3-phosphate 3-phosphatidyltransferase [Brevibacillus migulae]